MIIIQKQKLKDSAKPFHNEDTALNPSPMPKTYDQTKNVGNGDSDTETVTLSLMQVRLKLQPIEAQDYSLHVRSN